MKDYMVNDNSQHFHVFVSSTYSDLESHRKAVVDALHRLETVVHGMEYTGADPRLPLDVSLSSIQACKLFIGILAWRYGSIPKECTKSFVHLEYEEALRIRIPVLIYFQDEDYSVSPRHVERGDGARKLDKLKKMMRVNHTVSTFTSPEDLASRIRYDVPRELERIGAQVPGSTEILKESIRLPEQIDESLLKLGEVLGRYYDPFMDSIVSSEVETGTVLTSSVQAAGRAATHAISYMNTGDPKTLLLLSKCLGDGAIEADRYLFNHKMIVVFNSLQQIRAREDFCKDTEKQRVSSAAQMLEDIQRMQSQLSSSVDVLDAHREYMRIIEELETCGQELDDILVSTRAAQIA